MALITSKNCILCPRNCKADRPAGETGFCGMAGEEVWLSRAALHFWEEPCISGTRGSGTVFFTGCNLNCIYCQNHGISFGKAGKPVSTKRLTEIFFELREKGAENINLVTPTHYADRILEAIDAAKARGFDLPFVYNTGGYERVEAIAMMGPVIDIWLTDFKYMDPVLADELSAAPDYPKVAKAALQEMVRFAGPPVFDENGMMKKGVIVRNLLLPGHVKNSREVTRYVYETYGDQVYLSLMNQYTPVGIFPDHPELDRKVTKREYRRLIDFALSLGIENAFIQEGGTNKESFIPPFDFEGVEKK